MHFNPIVIGLVLVVASVALAMLFRNRSRSGLVRKALIRQARKRHGRIRTGGLVGFYTLLFQTVEGGMTVSAKRRQASYGPKSRGQAKHLVFASFRLTDRHLAVTAHPESYGSTGSHVSSSAGPLPKLELGRSLFAQSYRVYGNDRELTGRLFHEALRSSFMELPEGTHLTIRRGRCSLWIEGLKHPEETWDRLVDTTVELQRAVLSFLAGSPAPEVAGQEAPVQEPPSLADETRSQSALEVRMVGSTEGPTH